MSTASLDPAARTTDGSTVLAVSLSNAPGHGGPRTFLYRPFAAADFLALGRFCEEMEQACTSPQRVDLIFDAATIGMVGWHNIIHPAHGQPISYLPEFLDVLISPDEATDLLLESATARAEGTRLDRGDHEQRVAYDPPHELLLRLRKLCSGKRFCTPPQAPRGRELRLRNP